MLSPSYRWRNKYIVFLRAQQLSEQTKLLLLLFFQQSENSFWWKTLKNKTILSIQKSYFQQFKPTGKGQDVYQFQSCSWTHTFLVILRTSTCLSNKKWLMFHLKWYKFNLKRSQIVWQINNMIGKEEDLVWKKNVHQLNGCASAKFRIGVLHLWNISGAIFNTWAKKKGWFI